MAKYDAPVLATLNNDKLVIVGVDMLLICVCRYVAWDCVPKYDDAVFATFPRPTMADVMPDTVPVKTGLFELAFNEKELVSELF